MLNGGRAVNSKVKFAKFYVIFDPTAHENFIEVFRKFQVAFRKAVSSSKYGVSQRVISHVQENAFKPGVDGAFFNPMESVQESIKFVEDAINASGVNVNTIVVFPI